MKLTKSKLKEIIREELINEYDRGLTPNDLMKELKKVINKDVVKILNKYNQSIGNYMPAVIQKWMFDLHKDIKKQDMEYNNETN